jgi:hypothetical protein
MNTAGASRLQLRGSVLQASTRGLGTAARWVRWAVPCLCLAGACSPAAPPRAPATATPAADSVVQEAPASTSTAGEGASADGATGSSQPEAAASSGAIDLDGGDDLDADIAALSSATKTPEAKPDALSGRELIYRVTPQGLVIEVGGIHLRPVAKAFRDARGNYGVDLQLTAQSFDDRQYWLSKPEEGPLSIAGRIEGPGGKRQRFGDERRGDGEEVVRSGEPRQFKQRWPGKGQPRLRAGETLTLEVGLWGVHADAERERPVRRLFEVKLVGAQPPQAVVSPPTLDWGS